MLTNTSDFEAAAEASTRLREGACLPSVVVRTSQRSRRAVAFARPRPRWAADVFGQRRPAADLGAALGQPGTAKHSNPYMTRIAASGGAPGPHPVREPEPA
jgi:hypothetical protein